MHSREDFKFNFLKSIIIRLDFEGVFKTELDKVLPAVKPLLKENGFSRYEKKTAGPIEISVKSEDATFSALKRPDFIEAHGFVNYDKGYELVVSEKFVYLTVGSSKYIPFEDYSSIFVNVVQQFKSSVDFFTPRRLGIRKTNISMVEDICRTKEMFSPVLLGYYDGLESVKNKKSLRRELFEYDNCSVNLLGSIEFGTANNKSFYKVTLDIDGFSEDASAIGKILDERSELQKMNDILFAIYTSALSDSFKASLCGTDETAFAGIIGIESNE
ncbi:MAG: TIGR04255 family protein [bacterium]|nr:TIGR04255 family protein [bacterium]